MENHDNQWTGIGGRAPAPVGQSTCVTRTVKPQSLHLRTPLPLAGLPARTRVVRKQPFAERSPTPQLGNAVRYTAKKRHRTDPIRAQKYKCQSIPSIDVRIVRTKPTRCGKRVHPRRARSCKHVQSSLTHALYVQCHIDACTCALPYMRTRTEAAVRRVVPHSTTRQCGSVHYNVATQHVGHMCLLS